MLRSASRHQRSPLQIAGLTLLAGFGIVFVVLISAFMALAPAVAARGLPLFLIALILIFAAYSSGAALGNRLAQGWATLLVLVSALWPSYLVFKFGGLPSVDGRKIAFGISLVVLLYLLAARPYMRERWALMGGSGKALLVFVFLFALLRIVSAFGSPTPVFAFLGVVWEVVYYFSPFLIAILVFTTEDVRERVARTLLAVTLVIACIAVAERVLGFNPISRYAPVVDDLVLALSLSRFRDGVFRAQGTFEHPLMLAEFASMACAFGLSYLLIASTAGLRLLAAAGLLAGLASAYLSGSRVANVSVVVAFLTVLVVWAVRARAARPQQTAVITRLFIALVLGILAVLAVPLVQALVEGRTLSEASSSSARLQMIKYGVPAIFDAPFFGHGIGEAIRLAGVHGTANILTLDNYLLLVGIESGLFALLLFLALFLLPGWMIFKHVTDQPGSDHAFLIATLGTLLSLLSVRLILSIPYNMVFVYLLAGMAVAAIPRPSPGGMRAR